MAYQGYTNHQTWDVNLWLNNDSALYTRMRSILKANKNNKAAGAALEALCKKVWAQSDGTSPMTPDHVGLSGVNWTEIAQENRDQL